MDCNEFNRLVVDLGPDNGLPPELEQHRAACQHCDEQYHIMQEAWLLIPQSLPRPLVRPDFEALVMQQVLDGQQVVVSQPARPMWTHGVLKYVLAASVLVALLTGTILGPRLFYPQAPSADSDLKQVREFARQLGRLKELDQAFSTPDIRYVSLHAAGNNDRVEGYLLYDMISHEGHFFAYDLPANSGHLYKLWLIDQQGMVFSSVSIDVDDRQLGAAIVALPEELSSIREVIVTSETDAESTTPSTEIRMLASVPTE
ncbi:MAG: hypothetical protein R3E01_31250 [Pirellulaceae bacterium]|nr:hypothetical protein [Planctomycetales bacterium]